MIGLSVGLALDWLMTGLGLGFELVLDWFESGFEMDCGWF